MTRLLRARLRRRRSLMHLSVLASAAAGGAVLVVALVLTPAGGPAPPPAESQSPEPGPVMATPDTAVDMSEPEAVCRGFAAALFTATADGDPNDPYRRAAAYTTPTLAGALVAAQGRRPWSPPHPEPTSEPTVDGYTGDHLVPDTEQVAHRAAVVTVQGTQRHVVYCTLGRTGAVWLVADYERERTLP